MSAEHREFKGVWIPAELWLSSDLSILEKVMLVEIESLQHKERGCFKSNRSFAEFFNLSISRISEIISSLASKGLIMVEMIRQDKAIVERRIFLVRPFGKGEDPIRKTEDPLRKRRRTPSENTYTPPSEKAKGSNTFFSEQSNEQYSEEELLVPSLRDDTPSRCHDLAKPGKSLGSLAWDAYATAYLNRYGTEPVRNAAVNAKLAQLAKRLPAHELPHVIRWYVESNTAFYVRDKHSVGLLLKDCEGLRTEWATNQRVTGTAARQADEHETSHENAKWVTENIDYLRQLRREGKL